MENSVFVNWNQLGDTGKDEIVRRGRAEVNYRGIQARNVTDAQMVELME